MSATVVAREPLLRRPEIRFPVRFLVIGGVLAVGWSVLRPTSAWLRRTIADIVVWMSNLVGLQARTEPGDYVRFADGDNVFRYVVEDGCTATLVMATYAAAVVAYPSSRRSRAWGVALGVAALFAVNLLRLVSLGWVGLHARASFDAVHMYWWQVFYVAGTGVLWFAWAWWTSGARSVLPRRRSVSLPKPTTTVVVVVGQLLAFALLGLWAHGADLYYRLLNVPIGLLAHVVWGGQVHVNDPSAGTALGTYSGNYAQLAAVVALFLASPGLELRTRVRGVVRWALPSVIALHVAETLWSTAVRVHATTEGAGGLWHRFGTIDFVLTYTLLVGLSLVVWQVWLQQARNEEARRRLRAMDRRRGHGQAKKRRRRVPR